MPNSKRFWIKATIVTALLGALFGYLEAGLRGRPTLYGQKRQGIEASAPEIRVLVLGASQANQGLNPALWPVPAYNLASVGQDAYYDSALLESYLPRLKNLETVVLPISYVSFGSSLADTAETWRCFAYSQHFGLPNELPSQRLDLRNWSALALTEAWPALQSARRGFKDEEAPKLNAHGFEPVRPLEDEDEADLRINALTAAKRARYHRSILRAERVPENLARYRWILSLATAKGVRAVLVVFPVDASYAAEIPAADLKERARLLEELAEPPGIKVMDYFADARFDTLDFADVDHLSARGAEKFSRIFWREALEARR